VTRHTRLSSSTRGERWQGNPPASTTAAREFGRPSHVAPL
jgi:hypothetical protein